MSQVNSILDPTGQETATLTSLVQGISSVTLASANATTSTQPPSSSSTSFQIPKPTQLKIIKDYECQFLDALPLEIRHVIYMVFLPSVKHRIELTRPIERREPLVRTFKSLMLTRKKTRTEVKEWYKGIKSQYRFMETMQFGPVNPDQTIFSIIVDRELASCGCVGFTSVSGSDCFSDTCGKKILNRLGCYKPLVADPFRSIRHLHLTFGRDDSENIETFQGQPSRMLALSIAERMTRLQELNVFLHWGLSGQNFLDFWNGYMLMVIPGHDVEMSSHDVKIPIGLWDETQVGWPRRNKQKCRVTVWHGSEIKNLADKSVLENPMQKLISWPGGSGNPEIFEVKDLETGEVVVGPSTYDSLMEDSLNIEA